MGTFSVRAVIWNVAEPAKSINVDLLVDTDSTYTVIPGRVLEELGVKPIRAVRLRLTDGRVFERTLCEVGIEVEGFRASATPWSLAMRASTYWARSRLSNSAWRPTPLRGGSSPLKHCLWCYGHCRTTNLINFLVAMIGDG